MRVYYFSRKNTVIIALALILVLSLAGYINLHRGKAALAPAGQQPIFQGNSGQKKVAITVNVDWGEEYIEPMLEQFKKNDARVTFFVTGTWADKNAELLKKMTQGGHSIQNHGYRHCHFNNLSAAQITSEIKKAEEIIYNITGNKSTYFASPYGEYNSRLVQTVNQMGYKLIMWSADTIDWQRPAPATIVNRIISKVHNDAIILMHPTDPTVKALPEMLKKLKGEGYQMVTIDQILIDDKKDDGAKKGNDGR